MSSPPSDTFAEKLSNLLQASWDPVATGLQVTDVAWSHDKFETMTSIEQQTQAAIISTYNPPNPVSVETLSAQTSFVHETVLIDVILHTEPFGGTDATIATREAIRQLILAVIQGIQLNTGASLAGAVSIALEGEYVRGELPQVQRESFKVTVSNFQVSS